MSYVHAPRPRRLRQSPVLRDIVAETVVPAKCMMLPHFVLPGKGQRVGLEAMPGIERLSVDLLLAQVEADLELGIRQVILFGVPDAGDKDATGSAAAAETGVVPQAVRALKSR